MHARLQRAAFRMNWKGWSVAITTSCLFTQSTIALCDNHNINDNHITPLLTKQLTPDEFTVQSENQSDIHLKTFSKPENSFLEWGMHSSSKSPKQNKFFEKIQLKTVQFSSNVQVALDTDGNLYCKYNNDEWVKVNDFKYILDVAITNDTIYLIDYKGHLIEYQYHILPNKYSDPCIDKHINITRDEMLEKNIENCRDHRRKKSFSSMPINDYHKYLKHEYEWNSSQQFADFLTLKYNKNEFLLNDINNNMYKDKLIKVDANDYRIFTLSSNGNIYVRGDNQRGACGVSKTDLYITEFTKMDNKYFDGNVIDVGMGEDHTLFLTAFGRVFSCGADNLMQLGLGWTKRKCIKSDVNWTLIGEKGFDYTANSFDSNVDFEDDKDSEYFHEIPSYDEYYPRVVTGPYFDDYKVISVSCGDYHNAIIIEPLYSMKNKLKKYTRDVNAMNENEILQWKKELIENRRVITWGCGLCGQLGHCNFTNASEPMPVKLLEQYKEYNENVNDIVKIKPIDIKCGKEHTVVLMEGYSDNGDVNDSDSNKMIFTFGNNRYYQVSKKKNQNKIHHIGYKVYYHKKCLLIMLRLAIFNLLRLGNLVMHNINFKHVIFGFMLCFVYFELAVDIDLKKKKKKK
eukprot:422067_1